MGVLFPKGMVTLSQAFKGKTHDGRALRESGISQILRQASTFNRHLKVLEMLRLLSILTFSVC
jgi:hypothetical protein